jgi:glucose-6-phosphate isomerase
MTSNSESLPSDGAAWRSLSTLARDITGKPANQKLVRLGDSEKARMAACGISLDDSRRPLTNEVIDGLLALAEERRIEARRAALFGGAVVNRSEQRAALHPLLRSFGGAACAAAPQSFRLSVEATRMKMRSMAESLHSQTLTGESGAPIRDIVNIGIGGSEFGARLLCDALQDAAPPDLHVHFISSVDGLQIARLTRTVDPATALFIVSSKSFSTSETLANARALRAWCDARALDATRWYAVTGNARAASEFGIAPSNILDVPEWVGGRFSAWGAVGLPAALFVGWSKFEAWLQGGAAADEHFATAPLDANLPVRLALDHVWNTSFLGCPTLCVAAYDYRLAEFLPWAQQLEMESNGKSVTEFGVPVNYATAPVVWGGLGNNGQHTYFQMLREGTGHKAITLIGCKTSSAGMLDHAKELRQHFKAQSEALSQPSAAGVITSLGTLVLDDLDPFHLGALMATLEHATVCAGWLWGLNSFDQPGVELGKQLAMLRA